MSNPIPDDTRLLIRCPSCGQRFRVEENLRGRTVECGGCEKQFKISDDVIVRGRKFYPGERKDSKLNQFSRHPLASVPEPSSLSTAHYVDTPDPVSFEPAAPQRVVAGLVGVVGMVIMAMVLIFGSYRGGVLDGMSTDRRLVMVGFTGLLGIVLLVYANPRARWKALGVGLLMWAALAALPFVITEGSVELKKSETDLRTHAAVEAVVETSTSPVSEGATPNSESDAVAALRASIGTRPLEDEIERLVREGSSKRAVGLWLRHLQGQYQFLVKDYILRTTGAAPETHFYPRGGGDYLMVVTGINASVEEVAKIAEALGTVEKVHAEILVVEVNVNNGSFIQGAIDKLNDRKSPAFYDLNKRELESIDLERVSNAVKRLADAEPKLYRTDICRKLLALLGMKWVDFKGDVCRALAVWSETPEVAGAAALVQVKEMFADKKKIPQEMMSLIVKGKVTAGIPILDELWCENPARWESLYGDMGPAVEATLLRRFASTTGTLRQSIVRLLGRVGGAESLPSLEAAEAGAEPELKILIKQAIVSIRGRQGR